MRRKLAAIQAYLSGGFRLMEITSGSHHIRVVLANEKDWRLTVSLDRRDAEEILYGGFRTGPRLVRAGASWRRPVQDAGDA